jgi:hypothetical protein
MSPKQSWNHGTPRRRVRRGVVFNAVVAFAAVVAVVAFVGGVEVQQR